MIKLTISILGVDITKTGETVKEALDKFEIDPKTIKSRAVLIAERGDKKYERFMIAPALRRVFINEISKNQLIKSLELLLS